VWQVSPLNFTCAVRGTTSETAIAADGTLIRWTIDSQPQDPSCPALQRDAIRVVVTRPGGIARESIRVYTTRFLNCTATNCGEVFSSTSLVNYDVTSGTLFIDRDVHVSNCATGQAIAEDRGVVAVTGFPAMFDTLLTFVPSGQSLSLLTAAYPDGFRSADSMQVWTGDVRSMPDWSMATPLTCEAATTPAPGQLVTVADTLPDPAVGFGRYYITAIQHGADRRLGRQYVNGALSARDPTLLPICTP
jgi:hypothetical protein